MKKIVLNASVLALATYIDSVKGVLATLIFLLSYVFALLIWAIIESLGKHNFDHFKNN